MDPTLKLTLALMFFGSVSAFSVDHDFAHCERVVKQWASSSSSEENLTENKQLLRDLLFFLHIPRTGGRTYFHCFLRKLYDSSEECPRSYDKLHFDPRLLVTHDDYSVMSKLPQDRTSIVTILRNPIDRVFSTYEFSIEVAARFLVHPNLTSAMRMAGLVRSKKNAVSTLDIWPWKYLVPWMREELFARRDARKIKGINHIRSSDPYDMEDMVMPLHEYLDDPIAHELIHNGATFQIAGLTNNSHLGESHEIRHCIRKYNNLGQYILQVAKKRLDSMLYVGLTEDHRESATLFADVVGDQVISQAVTKSELHASLESDNEDVNQVQTTSQSLAKKVEAKSKIMTVEELTRAYEGCVGNLRKAQSRRRANSLKRILPANFTKEARLGVPDEVVRKIRSLNSLDLELYDYAKEIFAKEHRHVSQKLVSVGESVRIFKDLEDIKMMGKFLLQGIPIVLVFFFFLFLNARRRTSKVKF